MVLAFDRVSEVIDSLLFCQNRKHRAPAEKATILFIYIVTNAPSFDYTSKRYLYNIVYGYSIRRSGAHVLFFQRASRVLTATNSARQPLDIEIVRRDGRFIACALCTDNNKDDVRCTMHILL